MKKAVVMYLTLHGYWIYHHTHGGKKWADTSRSFHTGSLGLNNSVIIIGGASPEDYELSSDETHSDLEASISLYTIMLGPKSLQQQAVQTVYKYRAELPWKCLPKKLPKYMQYLSEEDIPDAQEEVN